jgi:hypothetical protein
MSRNLSNTLKLSNSHVLLLLTLLVSILGRLLLASLLSLAVLTRVRCLCVHSCSDLCFVPSGFLPLQHGGDLLNFLR